MSEENLESQSNSEEQDYLKPDPEEINRAKEVILLLGKTCSFMKVYPPENPSVKTWIDSFSQKIKEFLNQYGEFKIQIEEFSFSFGGEIIHKDEAKKQSLPFLFFKDGMRELSFHKGLDDEETQKFLETIKKEAELPHEDSDIVNTFWENDFVYIRHFALDEFLDSDIGDKEGDLNIDRSKFSSGKVELTPEDEKEITKRKLALGLYPDQLEQDDINNINNPNSLNLDSSIEQISESDIPKIESMLLLNRESSNTKELQTLLLEILFLEEKEEQFSGTLDVLDQCHQEVVYKADFAQAVSLLNHVHELKETVSDQTKEKKELLEKILSKAKDESSLKMLKQIFLDERIQDFDSFFQYLKILGPTTLSLAADIWEKTQDPNLRSKASNFLQEMGQQDFVSLLGIAQDGKTDLIKEVIAILGKTGNKEIIPHLEKFTDHKDKNIRLATIQALKIINDEAANEILLRLLKDEDGEVRTLALMNLNHLKNQAAFDSVMLMVKRKNFHKKNKMEKNAILQFLARSQNEKVNSLLQSFLKKGPILSKSRLNETRLCAVDALETMATSTSVDILKKGIKLRNKTLRQACKLALRKISAREGFV